ncbi:uncharacterized protein LOC111675900 [Lucilia cuprina]|uniref:uncharacterized protein LOC111675900 n=1 Tax=Lucilia cuprina TaxID=7375 RepID=UPI001F063A13|nr:uncharacterized protein LOC111675900 [Lucilia cuprina]
MSMFGAEFEQIWPKAGTQLKLSEFGRKLLKQCETIKKPENKEVDINEFKRKSSNFPLEFGTNTCRVLSQPKERYPFIQKQIASAYPVIHERVLQLYLDFLEHKCTYGHPLEKQLYPQLSLTDFVQRLLNKRCVTFMGSDDYYLLMSGQKGTAINNYVKVGTPEEKEPLIFKNVLSYDEAKLSAFLSVTSLTELINDGSRNNNGVIEKNFKSIEREGVVVGIIGARFEKPMVMEYQDILITKEQNQEKRGYGFNAEKMNIAEVNGEMKRLMEYRKLWQKFYESNDFLYSQVPGNNTRFTTLTAGKFDNVLMKKRYAITFDTLLLEGQARAEKLKKQAYIHIVGIGLGVWKISGEQTKIFLECFNERVKYLMPQLNNIGALHFSWFHMTEWRDLKHNGFIESKTHPS